MHTKEKEKSGTCCQIKDEQENAEQLTYEYTIKTKEPNEKIVFSSGTIICIKRLLGRQKMYLYTRWNETLILCMVL